MVHYEVIIGNPCGCHTREQMPSREAALARSAEWRACRLYDEDGGLIGQAYQATAYEVRIDLGVMEITHSPLD